jgi:hypothetical protein
VIEQGRKRLGVGHAVDSYTLQSTFIMKVLTLKPEKIMNDMAIPWTQDCQPFIQLND